MKIIRDTKKIVIQENESTKSNNKSIDPTLIYSHIIEILVMSKLTL